ncbi:MAG: nuclear transport factor 2 family protein [Allomuricauda sp.]|nr:MAG: nuclear transport factor 2 family protein [Allomuricauda sp.]
MKHLVYFFVLISVTVFGQQDPLEQDSEAITAMLNAQKEAWNNYDIDSFMDGYWKSDDLTFYGSGGVIKGWEATLERYKKSYPSKEHFGTLNFVFNEIAPVSEETYYVMGEYYLTRPVGNTNGIFMLVVKKIDGAWKVIADTSAKVK